MSSDNILAPGIRLQGPYVHKEVQNMAKINANYEAVYILQPDLSEEQIAALKAQEAA